MRLLGSMLEAIDCVTSNVPGASFPVFASGTPVERMFGFGPAANITLFSRDGRVEAGIATDRAAVPGSGVFLRCLEAGFDEVPQV